MSLELTTRLGYLVKESHCGDDIRQTEQAPQYHGYALYFFTRRAVRLLEG